MRKYPAISQEKKRVIAAEFVRGREIMDIAAEQKITPQAIYRLRNHDAEYQQIEGVFEREAVDRFRILLKRAVQHIVGGLIHAARASGENITTRHTYTLIDSQGHTRQVEEVKQSADPRILEVRHAAQAKLLDSFMRVVEGEVAAQQMENFLAQREALLAAHGIQPSPFPSQLPAAEQPEPSTQATLQALIDELNEEE
jgi:hypothetical protein